MKKTIPKASSAPLQLLCAASFCLHPTEQEDGVFTQRQTERRREDRGSRTRARN